MPSLEPYRPGLSYTYALGLYPTLQALTLAPERIRRVLLSSRLNEGAAYDKLTALCKSHSIRSEAADRLLRRLSGKDNCFAAAVISKQGEEAKASSLRHLVLHHPMDMGNAGTILRTALGFGFEDIAVITPAVDVFDPRVIRASMGALFSLRLGLFGSMNDYLLKNPGRQLYLFMLASAVPLSKIRTKKSAAPVSLVLGNEGSGLPPEFASLGTPVRIEQGEAIDSLNLAIAAGIGMYAFKRA